MQEPTTTNTNRIDLDNLPPLITVETAAAIRGNCTAFIRAKCRDGSIRATKLGDSWRINRDAFLAQIGLK